MNKFNNMPMANIKFLLELWDNPQMEFILAGPAALKPTKSLFMSGYLKPTTNIQSPFEYGTHWTIDRDSVTEEDIKEMRVIYKKHLSIN